MIYDIKQALAPDNLFLIASFEIHSDTLLEKAASLCYQPCRWALGRKVAVVRNNLMHTDILPPLLKIFERPWVQTLLRILVYIPTLIGRSLQALAEQKTSSDKYTIERIYLSFGLLEKANLDDPDVRKKCSNAFEFLFPTIEKREILITFAMANCIATQETLQTVGFLMPYAGVQKKLWKEVHALLAKKQITNLDHDRLSSLVKSLATDSVNGADNFIRFFRPWGLPPTSVLNTIVNPKNIEKDDAAFLSLNNQLIELGLQHLTEDQKKVLAKRLATGESYSGGYDHFAVSILIKLNFLGLDKLQTCERLLFGHQVPANPKDPDDTGLVKAITDDADRAILLSVCDQEMLFKLFSKHHPACFRDVRHLQLKSLMPILEKFNEAELVSTLKATPTVLYFTTIFNVIRLTPSLWQKLSAQSLESIFYIFHCLRLQDSNGSEFPKKSGFPTLGVLKFLTPEQLGCFLNSLHQAHYDRMQKQRRDIGLAKDALDPTLLNLNILEQLYNYRLSKHFDWDKARQKINQLIPKVTLPADIRDIPVNDLDRFYFTLPSRYYEEFRSVVFSAPEIVNNYLPKDPSNDTQDHAFVRDRRSILLKLERSVQPDDEVIL